MGPFGAALGRVVRAFLHAFLATKLALMNVSLGGRPEPPEALAFVEASSVTCALMSGVFVGPPTIVRGGLGVRLALSPRSMKSWGLGVRDGGVDKNAWARLRVVKASVSSLERAFRAAPTPCRVGILTLGGGAGECAKSLTSRPTEKRSLELR